MDAQEFTKKRRQTVQLPDGSEFIIRRIGVMDVLLAGGNPDLMVFLQSNGHSPAERTRLFAEKSKEMFERVQKDTSEQRKFCEAVMKRGIVEPQIDLSDLTFEECDMLAGAILKFSGFTKEAAEAASPLSRTVSNSKASMSAPSATVEGQANSSEREVSSPIASTRPAPAPASTGSERKSSE